LCRSLFKTVLSLFSLSLCVCVHVCLSFLHLPQFSHFVWPDCCVDLDKRTYTFYLLFLPYCKCIVPYNNVFLITFLSIYPQHETVFLISCTKFRNIFVKQCRKYLFLSRSQITSSNIYSTVVRGLWCKLPLRKKTKS